MKKLLCLPVVFTFLMTSCDSDSVTDEFNNSNGDTAKKLIERIEFESAQIEEQDYDLTVEYDSNNRVISASNGIDTGVLVYENDELATVTGGEEPFSISELYQDPYDAFEKGEVLEYDQSGNPISISVLEYDYEYINGEFVETVEEYIATISYDATPNPYFYTFEAAGLIEVMDRVQLNFSMMPQAPEIIRARALFPVNNPKSIVYRDENNEVVGEVKMDYVYDAENYPTSATFTVETEGDPTSVYSAKYFYKM
ncbi:hypothetical protein [Aquimarina sp. 2201CG5-10]|uniref:hypothetical protein n=1 Tax=Aquimarina callyspongiae TaxID=3098150 RepID=UPI002AB5C184|nr:hypothetical protein [Aquimarina sp. 2201CG5-10]MDY8135067.1 hypothetical protein [Aquimarina sp. 2201CG5-10]